MTETPLILGPVKSGVIAFKCKLGGSHHLKGEDILLLNTPARKQIRLSQLQAYAYPDDLEQRDLNESCVDSLRIGRGSMHS